MRLIQAAGFSPKVSLTDDQRKDMVACATSFLRSGGILTLENWVELGADERVAFDLAGSIIAVEKATRIGLACEGNIGRAAISAEVDGGKAVADILVERAAIDASNIMDKTTVDYSG